MGSNRITVLILLIFSFCLKAKKSPFDVSSQSGSATTALVSGVKISTVASGTNSTSTTTPTTNTPTTATIPAPPSNLVYTVTALQSKLIPGNTTVISPTITGTVSSWTISPSTLPPGVTFDATTGVITCSPPVGSAPFPLTNFTVTAINPGGNTTFTVPLQVLGSGENVWTVLNGVSGGDTISANIGLAYDSISNCLYVVGQTAVNLDGETNPTTGGNVAGFLSKYDLNGNRKWTRIFGKSGVGNTFPQGIAIDSTGNIFVSGSASSGNINGLTITASTAGFIIKYDTNGNQLWINSSAPSITHEGTGIALDSSGNPNLSTIVRATSLHQTNLGGSEAGLSIVKYNGSTGAYMTSVMVSTASGGTFRALQAYGGIVSDSSGNLYVGVATRSSVYCGSGTAIYNPALFRFDSNLNYLNCTGLTSPSLDSFPFSLAADSSGVYMSGYANSTFDGINLTGTQDAFFTKFDTTGAKQWTKLLGIASKTTSANSVGFSSGSVYISGMTSGNLQGNTVTGQQDMFVAKYDTNGNQIWLKMQGMKNDTNACSGQGCASSIVFDSNKTLYSFSSTNGSVGSTTNPAGSNKSLFLVRNVQ